MIKHKLSVVTITRNSENRIANAIKDSLTFADEVIVVDTSSLDRTAELAENAGATVVKYALPFDYSQARNFGNNFCTGDYIFHLDDDEFVEMGSKPNIRRLMYDPQFNVYLVIQENFLDGRHLLTAFQERIMRRGAVEYDGLINEAMYPKRTRTITDIIIENHTSYTQPKSDLQFDLLQREVKSLLRASAEIERNGGRATRDIDYLIKLLSRANLLNAGNSNAVNPIVEKLDKDFLRPIYVRGREVEYLNEFLAFEMALALRRLDDGYYHHIFSEVANGTTKQSPVFSYAWAAMQNNQGDFDGALKTINKALELNVCAPYLALKGKIYAELHRWDEVISGQQIIREINPSYYSSRYKRGTR